MPDAGGFTVNDAPPSTDAKRPLFRPLPPAPEFPVHALGPLREPAEAVQMRTQAPIAICAQSVLAAATLTVQAHRNVELPGAGTKPLTGLFASVADSGERKTSVDRIALAAIYSIEESWRETCEAELASYLNDRDAWKASRDTALKKYKGDRAAIKAALDAIGSAPREPPKPMLLVADPTPEALVLHLRDSRPWAGLFTAEGGILIGGSAFNDESRMRYCCIAERAVGRRADPTHPRTHRRCVPPRQALFSAHHDAVRVGRSAIRRRDAGWHRVACSLPVGGPR